MHTRKIRRYLVVPFLYVAVIFGLLFLQYSGTLTVRRSIDALRFVGTLISGEDETSTRISGARFEFLGVIFEFSDDQPMVLRGENGDTTRLYPSRYEEGSDRLSVVFEDGSEIRFEVTNAEPAELHILPLGTEAWPRDAVLVLPYRFSDDVQEQTVDPLTPETIDVRYDERAFFLSTPPRSTVDQARRVVEIPLEGESRLIRYAELAERDVNVVQNAFGAGQRAISDTAYRDMISSYIDGGYRAWRSSRFNGGSGTWAFREASPRFSEEILTAYLAEAWLRNDYTTAFNQMRRAADLHPDDVGLLSAVFLGNLREVTGAFVADDRQRGVEIAARLAARDPTILRDPQLIPFAALRGTPQLYRAVLEFVRGVDFRVVDLATAIGMFAQSVDVRMPTTEASNAVRRFEAVLDERLMPSVRQFEELFFLETAQGEVDVYWSIRAGDLIEQFGRRTGRQLYVTVGRNLVTSGLSLADEAGFIPTFLFFGDEGIRGQEGAFGPERLYRHLADNPWYPRMISLYDEVGHGSFIWTIADFEQIEITPAEYRFRLRYPENRTHYVIMHGVPEFESMNLFGLQWRNDPSFESYIKGRHYDATTETLMIKYTDDSTVGDIILFY